MQHTEDRTSFVDLLNLSQRLTDYRLLCRCRSGRAHENGWGRIPLNLIYYELQTKGHERTTWYDMYTPCL